MEGIVLWYEWSLKNRYFSCSMYIHWHWIMYFSAIFITSILIVMSIITVLRHIQVKSRRKLSYLITLWTTWKNIFWRPVRIWNLKNEMNFPEYQPLKLGFEPPELLLCIWPMERFRYLKIRIFNEGSVIVKILIYRE